MPSVNARIETALSGIGCPVGFQSLDDGMYVNAFPSITYFSYLDQPEGWAEDTETEHGWYVQVDIWSRTNLITLTESVIFALRSSDFGYLSGQDLIHTLTADDVIYHKALRFKYTQFM